MSNGMSTGGAAVPSLLEQLDGSIVRLEQSVTNLHASISYEAPPKPIRETKELGITSEKLLVLQKLIDRIDYAVNSIDEASANMHKF